MSPFKNALKEFIFYAGRHRIAERTGGKLCGDKIYLKYLGQNIYFDLTRFTFSSLKLDEFDKTLIIRYFYQASGFPPKNRWLSFLDLPEGMHHYQPFIYEALKPLAEKAFLPERLSSLNAVKLAFGSESYQIYPLPRLPLAVIKWDNQKSQVLFDQVCLSYLKTVDLYVLGIKTVNYLTGGI
ncbi:DUF3786 domain-containing protein [Carboxydothermus hydrogenoformans]|uniref:DUF3786 domain-containing protein n=1 Tax=Carboxydothermus hydrogenoformans (strain ATCC BAA-161 / DSM 6008 / Z-2901) TaxID=246194 RepID=Q3ACQ4_CARHZ|nr:DUF3786 domain-containing protein [Carboxydothermus hydrogenoformans]ABB15687.1 hypothetical protein CHY_1242 [Carboxydothermus hydrogenoformans Z-2901]